MLYSFIFFCRLAICHIKIFMAVWFNPWVRKISWRREWQPTSVFLPGEFHEQRSLVGYSPWVSKEPDTVAQLIHMHGRKIGNTAPTSLFLIYKISFICWFLNCLLVGWNQKTEKCNQVPTLYAVTFRLLET